MHALCSIVVLSLVVLLTRDIWCGNVDGGDK